MQTKSRPTPPVAPKNAQEAAPKRLKGVFSTVRENAVGTGTTRKKVAQTVYYFAEENDKGEITVRALNPNFAPSGPAKHVTREELLANFLPDPSVYIQKVVPIMRHIEETVERAEEHRAKGELFTAEFDYKEALALDEEHVRATFGLGLVYLERGDNEGAAIVFHRIVQMQNVFESDHKHLLNEFGIRLRKNRMYREALRYYFRIYALVKSDDHLLYNISRTLYEMGRYKPARHFIRRALEMEPGFGEGDGLARAIEAAIANAGKPAAQAAAKHPVV